MSINDEKILEEINWPEEDVQDVIEGIDPEEYYKNHSFRVVYQTNNFLFPQLVDLVNDRKTINVRPEYQRRLRWSNKQKSRLIESLLLNVPIPPLFFFESDAAQYEVMDGQQRISAIHAFAKNEFRLSGLNVLWPLNGLRFSDLPPRINRGLRRASISAITLLLESDVEQVTGKGIRNSDIRRFIFDRLNTGGRPLNAQELRNAVYSGTFNDIIIEITRNDLFSQIWGIPRYTETDPNDYYENPKRQKNRLYATMSDCEIVLRYFALKDPSFYKGSMRKTLDECMSYNSALTPEEGESLKNEYLSRLKLAYDIFGKNTFRIPTGRGSSRRMSVALQDAVLTACDKLWSERETLKQVGAQIQERIDRIALDEETAHILTGQGNTGGAVRDRLDLIEHAFRSAI